VGHVPQIGGVRVLHVQSAANELPFNRGRENPISLGRGGILKIVLKKSCRTCCTENARYNKQKYRFLVLVHKADPLKKWETVLPLL
jgi:hypothetical protein